MKEIDEPLSILYQELDLLKDFDGSGDPIRFLEVIDKIILKKDASCIAELIKYFDDSSEYSWVLEELKGSIEHFSMEDYLINILKNLNYLVNNSPLWADAIINTIFNDPLYLEFFRNNMHLASKKDLLKLFDVMEIESPHHKELIQQLRKKIT